MADLESLLAEFEPDDEPMLEPEDELLMHLPVSWLMLSGLLMSCGLVPTGCRGGCTGLKNCNGNGRHEGFELLAGCEGRGGGGGGGGGNDSDGAAVVAAAAADDDDEDDDEEDADEADEETEPGPAVVAATDDDDELGCCSWCWCCCCSWWWWW